MKNSEIFFNKHPKVSVCVVTYNQKKYLRECLEGLIAQNFSLDYEIIVGDDASTDGSTEVLKEFSLRYPDLIVPIFHLENVGPFKNYLLTHAAARGEYVCHMDGDDLAYPEKLRTQSEFLDLNLSHQFVWHQVIIFNDERSILKKSQDVSVLGIDSLNLNQCDLLTYGSIGFHSSMMYRNNDHAKWVLREIEKSKKDFIDYLVAVEFLAFGRLAASLNEVLGEYRYNAKQKTLSKTNKGFFKKQKTKILLLGHLNYFYQKYPQFKSKIFVHVLTNAIGDIHRLRGTALGYSALALKCLTLEGMILFFKSIKAIRKIRIS